MLITQKNLNFVDDGLTKHEINTGYFNNEMLKIFSSLFIPDDPFYR